VREGTAAPRSGPRPDRRQVLRLAALLPVALVGAGACSGGSPRRPTGPDPLVALADAARADTALAAAALAADPSLAPRVEPLRAARAEHAAALDGEVARAAGHPTRAPAVPASPTTGPAEPPTLARVRDAVAAAHRDAAALVPDLPSDRVGLVASVAVCCAAYAAVLA
jgi:hypothetical protein